MVIANSVSQLLASIDHASAAPSSPDSRSTMNPLGDKRPMPAIQSGKAANMVVMHMGYKDGFQILEFLPGADKKGFHRSACIHEIGRIAYLKKS